MDDAFFKTEIMMDSVCHALGDYGPKKRCLIVDYKDRHGTDFNQDLTVWHSQTASDEALVESVRRDLAQRGYTLTALAELMEDGKARALYLARGYLEEFAAEMGLTMPHDMAAALAYAGVHPVNWEELTHGGRI